jgi:hypothetical protein
MSKINYKILLSFLVLIPEMTIIADGFPIKNGRYGGGSVIELKLTNSQSNLINHHFKSGMIIKLTKSQQTYIQLKGNLKIPPTKLEIYHATDLANDCTCFAANLGFDFKPDWIEIPIEYLCSDKEAEGRKPDPNG